jgi:hypothetical protein
MTTVDASDSAVPRLVMSMPTSAIAATATGLIYSAGSPPAVRTSTLFPARWLRNPAAISDRPALCTHPNKTLSIP